MSRLNIDLTTEQHKFIKVQAALEGVSVKDLVVSRLFPGDFERFNDETLQAIRDSYEGNHLNTYSSVSELFDKFRD